MINTLPNMMTATHCTTSGETIDFLLTTDQQIEVLKTKLNEAIRHINNLEEKLLSSEDLEGGQ